ncbi:MAG: outer membrane beta-barrel protein [Bdellovibrionales bacterium]|nr:outer membrane beta-barrel protein [Bdellovibrionales bacterium]
MNTKVFLSAIVLFISTPCLAGIFEFSLSTSFKNSNIDANNYTKSTSNTASVSYYFGSMSAIEYSYTSGETLQAAKPTGGETIILRSTSTIHGLDLVFSFAERGAALQPFVKAGAATIVRKNFYSTDSIPELETPGYSGTVPSVGVGVKIQLTKTFSIKAGLDGWSIDNSKPLNEWDHAGRVGVSWLF